MAAPTITALSPLFATNNGGVSVTITGTNFNAPNVSNIMFGNLVAQSFIINSGTSITAIVPAFNEEAQVFVVVTNVDGSSVMNAASTFYLVNSSVVPDAQFSAPNPFFDPLANYVYFGNDIKYVNLPAVVGGGAGAAKIPAGSKFLIVDAQGKISTYDGN